MKLLIGAGAALLFASVAAAQTPPATPTTPAPPSACGEAAPAPAQPDMSHITSAQMTRANQAFATWSADARAKLQCRQNEVAALTAQARAAEAAYNAQAAQFNSAVNSWNAATTAYNARGSSSTSNAHDRNHSALGQHGPN